MFASELISEIYSIFPHQPGENTIYVPLDSNSASYSHAFGPLRQPSVTFFFFFFLMSLACKTLILFSQKTTHQVFPFTFPKLFLIGNNVFSLICTSQERLSLICLVLKMSVFIFTNNFKDSEMFLHLFPCWCYSKMLNTHNNMCNIASDNVYDNWRQLNPTVKNWMYFIQTQAEALTVCESNFEKSHLHKCTFGDDWEVKNIYTVTYTISPLKECCSLKCYHSSYNYYVWDKIYLCRTQKYVLHSIYIPLRLYLKNL